MTRIRLPLLLSLVILCILSSIRDTRAEKDKDKSTSLPATVVPVSKPDQWWVDRHALINGRANKGGVDALFVGDSITQGWEGKEASMIWEKYFSEFHPMNAGIGGDRTQHVLWRLQNGNLEGIHPKVMVLMIGTNNSGSDSAENIASGIREIVRYYQSVRPESKVLLLAIFPRSESPDERRKNVAEASRLASSIADGKSVFYLDIGEMFVESDQKISKEIMPDFLHLSPKGYTLWAEAVAPEIKKLIESK